MPVKFEDNSIRIMGLMDEAVTAFLYEAAGEITSQTKDNTRIDTGKTKGDWQYEVDRDAKEAVVGNPDENAIWEEYGTGEYALEGNGRKDGWYYEDAKGDGHFTYGKTPTQAMTKAFETVEPKIEQHLADMLKDNLE